MISLKTANQYCKDDISLIENYEAAVNSPEKWDCHHRLETDLNVSRKYLIDNDLYFNRPASELIFLSHSEHTRIHITGKFKGKNHPMYGKHLKDLMSSETYKQWRKNIKNPKDLMSSETYDQWRKTRSDTMSGEKNPMYGKIHPSTGKHRVYHEDGTWHMEK